MLVDRDGALHPRELLVVVPALVDVGLGQGLQVSFSWNSCSRTVGFLESRLNGWVPGSGLGW
jgi:hypothetical protein